MTAGGCNFYLFIFLGIALLLNSLFCPKNLKIGSKIVCPNLAHWLVAFSYFHSGKFLRKPFFVVINMPSLSDQRGRQFKYETAEKLINLAVDFNVINTY